jgi:hypothetical protein
VKFRSETAVSLFFFDTMSDFAKIIHQKKLVYLLKLTLHMPAIECKEGLCISILVDFEFLLELKIEQKQGTSRDSPCYKDATSFKQSVSGQYRLSVPVI